jgi:hypothetical protein
MRKVLLLFFVFFIFSCNKDAGCYDCKTTITINVKDSEETYSYAVTDTQTKCDLSDDEIRDYEKNNTGASTYTNGSLTIDTVIVTFCTK